MQKIGPLATGALAMSVLLLAPVAASAGFLDDLFGDHRQDSSVATMAYASPSAPPAPPIVQPRQPSIPSVGYGSVVYCVRLCDGRYYPLQRHPGATPLQMCSAFCPAAKTKVFTGSPIDHAYAADGARYADLDNAFVYRQKIVPDCTCNGRDAFGLATIDITKDTTLRAGDIVSTADGLKRFNGSQAALRKGGGFVPVQLGDIAGEPRRVAATGAARTN
jgi:uncharacterized protein DUF2865